jgi:fumarate hydratase class I
MDSFDTAKYRRITGAAVGTEFRGKGRFLVLDPEVLRLLAEEAFHDLAYHLRPAHLEKTAAVLDDPEASDNDRYVAGALLRNAVIAAEGVLPMCQDTGTATVIAWKGDRVLVEGAGSKDGTDSAAGPDSRDGTGAAALERGILDAYQKNYLRYSQVAPLSMFDEADTGTNLPAQIDIYAGSGEEYRFLFVAKGGGSANKTAFFQESKALLNPAALEKFIREKVAALGTAACPPYHLAMVVGGLSPEMNLKTLKLATTGFLDTLPETGTEDGRAFLDREWSGFLARAARESGLGAQFGGKHLALDARVIRLPRHAGSCPVSIGVSCSADRNVLAKITADGIFLEELDRDPARFLTGGAAGRGGASTAHGAFPGAAAGGAGVRIGLDRPMDEIRRELSRLPAGALVLLSGPLVVARDIVHAKLYERLLRSESLPSYFRDHPVYYAGPAKTPPGYAIGSFGPTTAQRMDAYLPEFMAAGASLVTLAKGNRSAKAAEACKAYGGFYLGTIGGAAALLAAQNISASEVIDMEELGMEAVRRIEVRDFPAFILADDKGSDFYRSILEGGPGRQA